MKYEAEAYDKKVSSSSPGMVENSVSMMFRPTPWPIEPRPIQWAKGAASQGEEWQRLEANHSPPISAEEDLYIHAPYIFVEQCSIS
jgi:hypothetical protein